MWHFVAASFQVLERDWNQVCSADCVTAFATLCEDPRCAAAFDEGVAPNACVSAVIKDGDTVVAPDLTTLSNAQFAGGGYGCEILFDEVSNDVTTNAVCLNSTDPETSCFADPCPVLGGPYDFSAPLCEPKDCGGAGPDSCAPAECNPRPELNWVWEYLSAPVSGCTCCNLVVNQKRACGLYAEFQSDVWKNTNAACLAPQ